MKIKPKQALLVLTLVAVLAIATVWLLQPKIGEEEILFSNQADISLMGPIRLDFQGFYGPDDELNIAIDPALQTISEWQDEVLEIWFDPPAQPGTTYTLTLTISQEEMKEEKVEHTWSFSPRQVVVIYMVQSDNGAELWVSQSDGSQPRRLTQTNDSVNQYDVSEDGNTILFSVQNRERGVDIWSVGRDGEGMQQVIACGENRCPEAVFLPRMAGILFLETVAGEDSGTFDQLNWMDRSTRETRVVYKHERSGLADLRVSEDGRWAVLVDSDSGTIILYHLVSGEILSLECGAYESGFFSPDSSRMIFACFEQGTSDPCKQLQEIRLDTHEVVVSAVYPLLERRDYSTPAWSPNGKWMVFGERCFNERITKQLYFIDLGTLEGKYITTDVRFNYAGYQWHPLSSMLVMQRFEIGASSAQPAVLTWQMATGELTLLAENAHTPGWLP